MLKPWMVIGGVAIVIAMVGGSLNTPNGIRWFRRLRRPRWLTFEAAIPFIWTTVFVCAAWSAVIVWEKDPGSTKTWLLMVGYLLLELVTMAFNPVTQLLRSLKAGTMLGGAGVILAAVLMLLVFPISGWAALLLVPYLLWSPIGTYTTWTMARLNPQDA